MTKRAAPILSPEARADLASITRYIAKESGTARARAVKARIVRGIRTVAGMPNVGRLRDDLPDQPRSFVVSPWLIFYSFHKDGIKVSRILDGRMDMPRHLSEP